MGRIFLVMVLGAALFFVGAYYAGLLEGDPTTKVTQGPGVVKVADITELGDDLYENKPFPKIAPAKKNVATPIVLPGVMNPIDVEEVPSQVPGRILFIGDQVDDSVVLAAGSAAFLAEPYYPAKVKTGGEEVFKFYRRLYEGQMVTQGQILAMIEPAKAWGEVKAKQAKVDLAIAEKDAAIHGENEGKERYDRAIKLFSMRPPAIAKEDLGSAKLTYEKLRSERIGKEAGVVMAKIEKELAVTELDLHEIRAVTPRSHVSIKSIVRQLGGAVKQLDPVIVVQSLERLQAEALIEEQYFAVIKDRLGAQNLANVKDKKPITATIEPTILEKPHFEFHGHDLDVTSVAVSRDMRIVSGCEDKSVGVWEVGMAAPVKKLDHDDAVKVVVCTPAAAGVNLCLAGCANGSIYLWDLDAKDDEAKPIKIVEKAHGDTAAITSLAFSPDGKWFASGASDGSIRMSNADGTELYKFIPENGVKQCHEDAVTALHFTPQSR